MNIDELLHDDATRWRQEVDETARDYTVEDWTAAPVLTNPHTLRRPRNRGAWTRVRRWLPGAAAAALVVVAAVVVGVLARHSSQPRHSPGPTIPVEITASVNGMPHTLGANVKVAAGSRVRLSAHIQAPTGASIRHGYLYVASPPYGNSPNGPTGNSRILAYQVGALTDNTIAANWLAAPAFGHKTLTVGLQFDYFKGSLSAGMGYVLIQIVVS